MSNVDRLDEKRLADYLQANITGFTGPLTASKFSGGQSNPTFKIETASGSYVLRRQPPSHIPNSMSGLGDKDIAALGIPSEQEYVARYCQPMGVEQIDNWAFYLAFSLFRLAAITQGVAKRAADGNASSATALEMGAMVQPLAAEGLSVISQA